MNKRVKLCLALFLALTVLVQYSFSPQAMVAYGMGNEEVTAASVDEPSGDDSQTAEKKEAEKPAPAPEPTQATTAPAADPEPSSDSTDSSDSEEPTESTEATEPTEVTDDTDAASEEANTDAEDPTTVEEEAAVDEEEAEEEEEEFPAQSFSGSANGVSVKVSAPKGALPKDTKMSVSGVSAAQVESKVEAAIGGEAESLKAVDITFRCDGKEIEPKKAVSVHMNASGVDADKVVHIADNGHANVVGASTSGSSASFKSADFSIYIVVEGTDPHEDARLTVNFFGVNDKKTTMYVTKKQLDQIEDYIYDPGVAGLPEGTLFKGWADTPSYTDKTASKTINTIRTEIKALAGESGFTENQTVNYYAMLFTPHYVTYLDEKGIAVKTDEVIKRLDDSTNPTYTFNYTYVPYANTDPDDPEAVAEFIGWKQLTPTAQPQPIHQNGESISLDKDYIVQADVEFGHWLSFNKNGSGASYTGPVFILTGKNASSKKPANPERKGFEFVEWCEDADCTVPFNWDSTISANKTLYAHWEEHTTAYYYFNIWKQSVDGNGYDLAESIRINNAAVGSEITFGTTNASTVRIYNNDNDRTRYARVNGSNKQYEGFHLQSYDTGKKVASNNSTVVNLYYDRNTYTLRFRSSDGRTTYKTITGLYGSYIGNQFPIESGNGYVARDGDRWKPSGSQGTSQVIVYLQAIPAEDINFNLNRDDHVTRTFYLYEEALPGSTDTVTFRGKQYTQMGSPVTANLGYVQYSLDYVDIEGYTKAGADPNYSDTHQERYQTTFKFYYDRVRYTLHYQDGVYTDKNDHPIDSVDKLGELGTETVAYGFPLSGYDKKCQPTRDEYKFVGWYADEACTTPYEFDSTNMPMNDVTVYAKWTIKRYQVNIKVCDDDGEDKATWNPAGQALSMTLDYGETVSLGNIVRDYHDFIAWYSDEDYKHLFNTDLEMNDTNVPSGTLTLYARWRSKLDNDEGIKLKYDATQEGSGAPTDNRSYTDKADAIAGTASQYNDDTQHFKHWSILDKDGAPSGKTVLPGDTFTVDVNDAVTTTDSDGKHYTITLQAVYEPVEEAKLTFINFYNGYGGLVQNVGGTEENPTLAMNKDVTVPDGAAQTREGYTFKGWTKKADNGESVTTSSTDSLFITWNGSAYNHSKIAADEILTSDGKHEALYGVWEPKKYKVTWYNQAGTTALETDPNVPFGTKPSYGGTEPTKDADENYTYTFAGWATSANQESGTAAANLPTVTKNTDYYAAFTPVEKEVTINYESADTTMGTVAPASETVKVLSGTPGGATATAKDGYEFVNWTKDGVEVSTEKTFAPDKVGGKNVAATYTANFKEKEVTINYKSADTTMGTVAPASETVGVLTGEAAGAEATAEDGYEFVNWTKNGVEVSTEKTFVPEKVDGKNVAATYTANFKEKEVTINYESADTTMGTVAPANETVGLVTGTIKGSTATPIDGYKFVNWTDENGGEVSTNTQYVPSEKKAAKYTAHFEKVIEPQIVTVEINTTPKAVTYNGKEQNNGYTISYKIGDSTYATLPEGLTANIEGDAVKGKDIGDYTTSVSVTVTVDDAHSAMYIVEDATASATVKLTINPANATITAQDNGKIYGEADPKLTATPKGFVKGDSVKYEVSREAGEAVGTYVITVSIPGAETVKSSAAEFSAKAESKTVAVGNYKIKLVNGTFTISAPTEENITPTPTPTPDDNPGGGNAITRVIPAAAPIAPATIVDNPAPKTIDEPAPPKAVNAYWALINLLCAIATALLSLVMLIRYFGRKKEEDEQVGEEVDVQRKGLARIASLIPAIGGIIAFILTEDMSLPMAMVDKWTVLMVVILAVQAGVGIVAKLRDDKDDEDEEAMA